MTELPIGKNKQLLVHINHKLIIWYPARMWEGGGGGKRLSGVKVDRYIKIKNAEPKAVHYEMFPADVGLSFNSAL